MSLVTPAAMRDPRVRAAGLLLLVATLVLAWALVGAVRVDTVSAAAPPAAIHDSALKFAATTKGTDVVAANARDLFTDDRRPPARRYLMPDESDTPASAPPPLPTILGTSVGSDGDGFATSLVTGGVPTIIRVGSKVNGYTVTRIERGRVIFRDAAGVTWTVDASKP